MEEVGMRPFPPSTVTEDLMLDISLEMRSSKLLSFMTI
jgi:hypothetical protein